MAEERQQALVDQPAEQDPGWPAGHGQDHRLDAEDPPDVPGPPAQAAQDPDLAGALEDALDRALIAWLPAVTVRRATMPGLALVLVVAANPELLRVALVASLGRAVEQRVEAHHDLDAAGVG